MCKLDLSNKVVMSVLFYGCEVWSCGNVDIAELFNLKFLKHIIILQQ